jgi:uncharacterized phage protein gp47/JayE
MMSRTLPPRHARDADALRAAIEARRVGYVPTWNPPAKSAGAALAPIGAHLLAAIVQRLERAPHKDKLAFLDCLGLRLVPAHSARAPIVFQLAPGAAATFAPEGTQVAAPPPPGGSQQIVFSTERDAGIAAATLAQVVSLWPGRDQYLDHSAAQVGGTPFTLFDHLALRQTDHILYLAHDVLLALAGGVSVDVVFDLAQGGSAPLELAWEYWDSQVWRGFRAHSASCLDPDAAGADGTDGLVVDGTVRLVADVAQSAPMVVNGVQSHWIRGRVTQPLPPDPARLLPSVETIRLRTTIDQRLRIGASVRFALQATAQPTLTVQDAAGQPLGGVDVTIRDPANPNAAQSASSTEPDQSNPSGTATPNPAWAFTVGTTYQVTVSCAGVVAQTLVDYRLPSGPADVSIVVDVGGLLPEKAVLNGKPLDVSKAFLPFGQAPQIDTALYFKQTEIFSKPRAHASVFIEPGLGPFQPIPPSLKGVTNALTTNGAVPHIVSWEYWNGDEWVVLVRSKVVPAQGRRPARMSGDFTALEVVEFDVPDDMAPTKVDGDEGLWMRARLVSGGFGVYRQMKITNNRVLDYIEPRAPIVAALRFGYSWTQGPVSPKAVVTYNDFQYEDHTEDALWPGNAFTPFGPVSDATPTVYLGFDDRLPVGEFGLSADVGEASVIDAAPALQWEYWDGGGWRAVAVEDETEALATAGMLTFLPAADSQVLARFGRSLHWLRGRQAEDGPPNESTIRHLHPNAVWASQWQTFRNLPLGASTGAPRQTFQFSQIPVLAGQTIEVQELSGPRANTEWRVVAMELGDDDPDIVRRLEALLGTEGTQEVVLGALRLARDKTKRVTAVNVRWTERPDFFDSGSTDRHYVLDHATGRLFFGSGDAGKIPPSGAAIQATLFRSGGGDLGNVPSGTIKQLLGTVAGVQSVTNPRSAEGGADGETLDAFAERAPSSIHSRGAAIGPGDYETLAHEASAGVAVARVMSRRSASSPSRPGWVTVMIMPRSQEPRPTPSAGLRNEVRDYLERHAPCDLAAARRIEVIGPRYVPVDVTARVAPKDVRHAGTVERALLAALARFLHPLLGGPEGLGWDLGRGVFLSDVAAVLGGVAGVDYVEQAALSRDGIPQGDHVDVGVDQIAVAGALTVTVVAGDDD